MSRTTARATMADDGQHEDRGNWLGQSSFAANRIRYSSAAAAAYWIAALCSLRSKPCAVGIASLFTGFDLPSAPTGHGAELAVGDVGIGLGSLY
jgi:hypothetical protein